MGEVGGPCQTEWCDEVSYELKNGSQSAATCASCKQGIHSMCQYALDGFFDSVGECCCQHDFDLVIHAMSLEVERSARVREAFGELAPEEEDAATELAGITAEPAGKKRGDSGYIHPDAWPSSRDIDTFVGVANAQSTGYKRATKMYKGLYGNVCEWANLAAAGGGVVPIVGCMGNKATDLHHGPDKNTFNNAKQSVGVGDSENVHLICSFCHNAWHGVNDEFYGPYDRSQDTPRPHVPTVPYAAHDGETKADLATLVEIEEQRRKAGRNGRQRNPDLVELGIDDAYDEA